jgi:hypothetical protein
MKFTHSLLIKILLASVCLPVMPAKAGNQHAVKNLGASFRWHDREGAVVPIHFYQNEPVAEVRLNGYQSNLIIDLGTTTADAMILKRTLDAAHATYLGVIPGCYMTNFRGNKFACKQYMIKKFQLGGVTLNHINVIEFPGIGYFTNDPKGISAMLNNGTIGIELLKKFNVLFDYHRNQMILISKNKSLRTLTTGWTAIPFYYGKSGNVLLKGKLNTTPVVMMLDTGNSASTISADLVDKYKFGRLNANKEMTKINDVMVGLHHDQDQFLLIRNSNKEADVSLGAPFFSTHLVYLDFKNSRMYIK